MGNAPTNVEQVSPKQYSKPVRLDGWRWEGVPSYEGYLAHVLKLDAERAARVAS